MRDKILLLASTPLNSNSIWSDKRYQLLETIIPFIEYEGTPLNKTMFDVQYLSTDTTVATTSRAFEKQIDLQKYKGYKAILTLDSATTSQFIKVKYSDSLLSKTWFEGVPVYPIKVPFNLSDANQFVYRFADIITEIFGGTITSAPSTEVIMCQTPKEWAAAIDECIESHTCCFDVETNQVDDKNNEIKYYMEGFKITIISVSPYAGRSYVMAIEHKESLFTRTRCEELLTNFGHQILENPNVIKIAHNAKYDLNAIMAYTGELKFKGRFADTVLMAKLVNENESASLERCTEMYLPTTAGYKIKNYNIALADLAKYGAQDTDNTIRLFYYFEVELKKDMALYKIHRNLQSTVFWELMYAERIGAYIDRKYIEQSVSDAMGVISRKKEQLLTHPITVGYCKARGYEEYIETLDEYKAKLEESRMKAHWTLKIAQLEEKMFDFNLSSPKQLSDFLYLHPKGLNLIAYDEETGLRTLSTQEETLRSLDHELIDVLLDYRKLEKVVKTFYMGILNGLDPQNRLHANFNLVGTVTGRISSTNPNLQNLITRTSSKDEEVSEIILRVKKFFIPKDENHVIMQGDFSQLELRLIAIFSQDPNMIEAYKQGMDLHCLAAALINDLTYEDFLKEKAENRKWYDKNRFAGKGSNFSLSYGSSAQTYRAYVKQISGVVLSLKEAELHRKMYFAKFPSMLKWHQTYRDKAEKYGYVRTLFGQKRRLPDIKSNAPSIKSKAERVAVNAPIQGTGGQIALFLIVIANMIIKKKATFFNTVHDSLIYDVPKENVEKVTNILKITTEKLPTLFTSYFECDMSKWSVPLVLDVEVGDNWKDVKG